MTRKNWCRVGVTMLLLITVGLSSYAATVHASTPQLTYVCGQAPCVNSQEFTIFDPTSQHNPIFSVGEFGGAGVFGDNMNVYSPRKNILNGPVLVMSYDTPQKYAADNHKQPGCIAPETWIAPSGVFSCKKARWVQVIRF